MKASSRLYSKIKEFEGWRMKAYLCPAGKWTIGAGHTAGVRKGMTITEAQAEKLLSQDIAERETQINSLGLSLTQGQFDALVDFVFNFSLSDLKSSTLLVYIQNGSTDLLIAREFMRWVHAHVGKKVLVLGGLVARRQWEAEQFIGKEIYKSQDNGKWYIRK